MLESFMTDSVSILLLASLLALFCVTLFKPMTMLMKFGALAAITGAGVLYFNVTGATLSFSEVILALLIGLLSGWILTNPQYQKNNTP